MTKRRFARTFITLCIAAVPWMFFMGCNSGQAPASAVKVLDAGATWEVAEIARLDELTIAKGATITAPEGSSVTLTVDGVETPIAPGTFAGDVVLTPAENIVIEFGSMGASATYNYRAAIYVDGGAYVPEKSVAAAVVGGDVTETSASDVSITSVGENFNGILAKGDSTYTVRNPKIDFTGNGGNDFAGYGAAVMSSGNADITVENANIVTRGAVRTAVFVGGNSTMHVNDSYIEVHNGTLPADYEFSVMPGEMMEVPWMLGIAGNVRATNLAGSGTAYYNNTHIKAQGWGCLSTDDVTDTKLYATNCTIETVESGYGGFTLGNNVSTFSGCTFNVTDQGLVSQDGDGVFTDGTVVNSGRFGVMYFGSTGDLTIDKGCVFKTKSTALMMKGSNSNIIVDNAQLNPENGIILQMMENDDPYMANMSGGGGMPGGGGGMPSGAGGGPDMGAGGGAPPEGGMPGGGMPEGGMPPQGGMPGGAGGEAPGGAPPTGGAPGGGAPPEGGMPGGMAGGGAPGGGGSSSSDVNATFSNMTLTGDIVNGNTANGALSVAFKNATITGAITTATIENALGPNGEEVTMEHPELYYLIGEVTNTYCATGEKNGASVSLDAASKWVVDNSSYLTRLTIAEGAAVIGPEGGTLAMTVDGVETEIKAGTYTGNIVLTVAKPTPDHDPLINAIDTNKDGRMSYEEWHGKGMPDSSWEMLNKDGYVTKEIMLENDAPDGIDLNGDGKLTLEEFLEFDKKMAPPAE